MKAKYENGIFTITDNNGITWKGDGKEHWEQVKTESHFQKWLDENGFEVGMVMHGNCAVVCRKDGQPIKENYTAMSPEDLFNAGYNAGIGNML